MVDTNPSKSAPLGGAHRTLTFDPTRLVEWVPLAGAVARVLFGYCMMARMISLLPWNRSAPFSVALLGKTFFSAPTRGNILHGQPPVAEK